VFKYLCKTAIFDLSEQFHALLTWLERGGDLFASVRME